MATNVGDFFMPANLVSGITEEDYYKAKSIINVIKAIERSTYQGVYVIDYFKKDFFYVSQNLSHWCGEPAEKIRDFGYKFYIDYVPENDLKMLLEVNQRGFAFFN